MFKDSAARTAMLTGTVTVGILLSGQFGRRGFQTPW